jgi:hypothetical protein
MRKLESCLRCNPSEIVASWNTLSDADKLQMLPKIMDSTPQWKEWAFSRTSLVTWLKLKFQQANVPFPL